LARVEPRARLVEQKHGWIAKQPDRDVDPLLVSTRQGRHRIPSPLLETRLLEHPPERPLDVGHPLHVGE
jgi:hypothetical protein